MVRVHSGLPFFSPASFSTCDFLSVFAVSRAPAYDSERRCARVVSDKPCVVKHVFKILRVIVLGLSRNPTHRTSHGRAQLRVACRKKDRGRQSGRPGQ
jgi:hypothetical protein